MDDKELKEVIADLKARVSALETTALPKKERTDDKHIESPIDLKVGYYYRLRYRLRGQKATRFARLQFLGFSEGGAKTDWSGRPTIGTLCLYKDEILECIEPAAQSSKATYFDSRCHH